MKIEFGGDFVVPRKAEDVYKFLVDPERFCPLLPDYQSMQKHDDKNFSVKLSVGISHIRGTAVVKMTLAEEKPTDHAVYEGKGDVPGGMTTLRAGFDLEPNGARHKSEMEGRSADRRTPPFPGGRIARAAGQEECSEID